MWFGRGASASGSPILLLQVLALCVPLLLDADTGYLDASMPVWSGGSNLHGMLGAGSSRGKVATNWEPSQILGYAVAGAGQEVIDMAAGTNHMIALATLRGQTARTVPRKAIVWGDNSMGQIGESGADGDVSNAVPRLMPRSLFPRETDYSMPHKGNEIHGTNRRVCFYRWDDSAQPGGGYSNHSVLLTEGVRGIKEIELEINEQMGADYISITAADDGERVNFNLLKPGVQFDFRGDCSGLASRLSFEAPYFKLPAVGLFGEISQSLNNNLLVLRQWSLIDFQSQSFFLFRGWSNERNGAFLYNITIDRKGVRTPKQLADELNEEARLLGFPSDLFDFGPETNDFPNPAILTIKYFGFRFLFEDSFAGWQSPPLDLFGFRNQPDDGFFKGIHDQSLPNEVSDNARTRRFHYRYMNGNDAAQSSEYELFLTEGIRHLEDVLAEIRAQLQANSFPTDSIDIFADADGIVNLQMKGAGFQVLFGGNHSIASYLGFEDYRDFPCNNLTTGSCAASEVVDANCSRINSTDSAIRDMSAKWCGLTQGTDLFQKRGNASRRFISRFTATGLCSRPDGRTGTCACRLAGDGQKPLEYCTASAGMIARISTEEEGGASGGVGNCSCSIRSHMLKVKASRPWGIFTKHSLVIPDGIYNTSSLNGAFGTSLTERGMGSSTLQFLEEGSRFRMKLSPQAVGAGARLQVDFNASTITDLLGFERSHQPSSHTQYGFEHIAESTSALVTGQKLTATANSTGEWIINVVAGHQHTLVQTCMGSGGNLAAGMPCQYTRLWALGSNEHGQLGTSHNYNTNLTNSVPVLVPKTGSFDPENARSIHAGGSHSAVVDAHGDIWVFGDNTYGQTGQLDEDTTDKWQPKQLGTSLRDLFGVGRLKNISLVLGQHHTLVRAVSANNTGMLWALGKFWQPRGSPIRLQIGVENSVTGILCSGDNHGVFKTSDGRLWAVGDNTYGQLGVPHHVLASTQTPTPVLIGAATTGGGDQEWADPFEGRHIGAVRCGRDHTAVLAEDKLVTFGSNVYGQLLSESNAGLNNPNYVWLDFAKRIAAVVDSDLLYGHENAVSNQPILQVWLSGDTTFVQTLRQKCNSGHFGADGHQPCFQCTSGTYQPRNSSSSCTLCSQGKFSAAGQTTCDSCAAGKFANETGMGMCLECPASRPGTVGKGATSLDSCVEFCTSGTYGVFGTPPCSVCRPGTFSVAPLSAGPENCTECARGTYQSKNSSSTCDTCAEGKSTTTMGKTAMSDCLDICKAGTAGDYGLAPCNDCSMGKVAPSDDMAECVPCGNGTYMNITGQTACFACSDGKGTAGEGMTSVLECIDLCAPGNYSDVGVEPCQQCAAGKHSRVKGEKYCEDCEAGKISAQAQAACQDCNPGSFAAGFGNDKCESCKAGQFQDAAGQTSCLACPAGFYQNQSGGLACFPCEGEKTTRPPVGEVGANSSSECMLYCSPGTNSSTGLLPTGQAACDNCTEGYATTQNVNGTCEYLNGSWTLPKDGGTCNWGATECLPCLIGSYTVGPGAPICLQCPAGKFSDSTATSGTCISCEEGYFSKAGATACVACSSGSFANGTGQSSCFECKPGSYQNSSASSGCVICEVGKYTTVVGSSAPCNLCQEGKYANLNGSAQCQPCAAGSFSPSQGLSACTVCEMGKFSGVPQSAECEECAGGKYADNSNMTSCLPCAAGKYASKGWSVCKNCSIGFYSEGAKAFCESCGNGYNTSMQMSVSIEDCLKICNEGQIGEHGLSSARDEDCLQCPIAYYSDQKYSTACTACAAGKYTALNGTSSCSLCPAGSFAPNASSSCTMCSPGEFGSIFGMTHCRSCEPGTFAQEEGSTRCTNCSLGYYQNKSGSSSCQSCPSGSTPKLGAKLASDCQPFCVSGTYTPREGNGVDSADFPCRPCVAGKFNPYLKMTFCYDCPEGKFSASEKSTRCENCAANTYSDRPGSNNCTQCASNVLGDPTYTILGSGLPSWMVRGASKVLDCREVQDIDQSVYNIDSCYQNPRNLSIYPLYGSGRNDFGQTILNGFYSDQQSFNYYEMRQNILDCKAFMGLDISRFKTGGYHSVVETVNRLGFENEGSVRVSRGLWMFGSNSHGQLGTDTNIGTSRINSIPGFVPSYLFPATPQANEISAGMNNNKFGYWFFSSEADGTNITRMQFLITIPDGYYSPVGLANFVSQQASAQYNHAERIFLVEPDDSGQFPMFMVARPGFQADFTIEGSARANFGVTKSERIPPSATLNEISAAAGNNIFAYRYYCGTYLQGTPKCNNSRTVRLVLPDGIYDLPKLERAIQLASLENGDDDAQFRFLFEHNKVKVRISTLFQILFNVNNSLAHFLGFNNTNAVPADGPASYTHYHTAPEPRQWLFAAGTKETSYRGSGTLSGQMMSDFHLGSKHTLVQTWDVDAGNRTRSRLWAFGSNLQGQLGVQANAGSDTSNHVPLLVSEFDEINNGGIRRAVLIKVGAEHSMVMDSNGTLWLFGSNKFGQLGVSNNSGTANPNWRPFPFDLRALNKDSDFCEGGYATSCWVHDFALGHDHSLVLAVNDMGQQKLWSFGSNQFGQLGNNSMSGICYGLNFSTPEISHDFSKTQICDDIDFFNRLPVANWEPRLLDPTLIGNIPVVSMYAGGFHNLILTQDGRLWCFGSNQYGQCGVEVNAFTTRASVNWKPLVLGSKEDVSDRSKAVQPPAECCTPKNIGQEHLNSDVDCPNEGYWKCSSCAGGSIFSCPLENNIPKTIQVGWYHTIVVAGHPERYWSFGLNDYGQLFRKSDNFRTKMANERVIEIPPQSFGYGNQALIGQSAGGDQSFFQSIRQHCAPGTHSIDRRQPCSGCEPGSFAETHGTLTNYTYSFDQSVKHPYTLLQTLMYIDDRRMSCKPCPAGSFASSPGQGYCDECQAGSYTFSGASTCHNCAPGTYANSTGSGNCTLCSPGFTSEEAADICDRCATGTYTNKMGMYPCVDCEVGKYNDQIGASFCKSCNQDEFQNETGKSFCMQCAEQTNGDRPATIGEGSTSVDDCLNLCLPGYYGEAPPGQDYSVNMPLQGKPCLPCTIGYHQPLRGATSCNPCQSGSFSNTSAASICFSCLGGQFSSEASTICNFCAPGKYSLPQSAVCTACDPGKFSLGGGNVNPELCAIDLQKIFNKSGNATSKANWTCSEPILEYPTECKQCDAGFKQENTGQTFCTACAAGKASIAGSPACSDCLPGTFSNINASAECLNCSAGYFSATSSSTACDICTPGSYSRLGASVCVDCSPGLYAYGPVSGYAAVECQNCAPGQFSDSNATANCTLCPAGSYGSQYGMSACVMCAPGSHTPAPGHTDCKLCREGTYSLQNFTSCLNCSKGQFNNLQGQQNCTDCDPGYFAPTTGLSVCLPCVGGSYGNSKGLTICDDCQPGFVSTQNATVCTACVPGTFANLHRMTSCLLCAVGQYVDKYNASSCIACPEPLETQGRGHGEDGRPVAVAEWYDDKSKCMPACEPGEFSIWGVRPIYDNCTKCAAGEYGPAKNSTSCLACAAGNYSEVGFSACLVCSPGTYSTLRSSKCKLCKAGRFQWQSGQSSCIDCPEKMYSEQSGQTVCGHCPIRIDAAYDTLYYTDCRANCSSMDLEDPIDDLHSGASAPECCKDVPFLSINLLQGIYQLEGLEAEINQEILQKSSVSNLTRLEVDYLNLSRSGGATISFSVRFGGFIFHLYDPATSEEKCTECAPGCDFDSMPEYCLSTSRNVGGLLGFEGTLPTYGATKCINSGSSSQANDYPLSCGSNFSVQALIQHSTLITKTSGENSSNACEAFCAKGKFSSDGLQKAGSLCSSCFKGNYTDVLGSTSCKRCDPGTYSADKIDGYESCVLCEKGKVQAGWAETTCAYCDQGSFYPFEAGTKCQKCPAGTYSLTTSAANLIESSQIFNMLTLNASHNALPDTCIECPAGKFSARESATACDSCTPGKAAIGSASKSCSYCRPGYYSNSTGSTGCSKCNEGSRSLLPSNSTSCVWCQAGTSSPGDASVCYECIPGKFALDRASQCSNCAAGFESLDSQATTCQGCVPGKFSIGSASLAVTPDPCKKCPVGKYANETNSTRCRDCVAGSFNHVEGSSSCSLCIQGKFSADAASVCSHCPPIDGKETSTTGEAKTSESDCLKKCDPGYSGFNGVEPCYLCQPGTSGAFGTPCREKLRIIGLWTDTGLSQTYVVGGQCLNNSCPLCDAGTYSPQSGLSYCLECAQHRYSNAGQANCTKCPGTTVTDGPGASSLEMCVDMCIPGAVSPDGVSPCTRCPAGTYGQVYGMTACTACPAGKFQPLLSGTTCVLCPPGTGTFLQSQAQESLCQGIAPKYLYDGEALDPLCDSNWTTVKDQSALDSVSIGYHGSGYVDGILVMVEGQGAGFVASFQVSVNGSIISTSVQNAGSGYTSDGLIDIRYSQLASENKLKPSNYSMSGSISRVTSNAFLDLSTTPSTVLFGCSAGYIEVDDISGGTGFRADYSVEENGNVLSAWCIGQMTEDDDRTVCQRQLDFHGRGYRTKPRMRLVETSVKQIRVRAGHDNSIRGCNDTNSRLRAYGGGPQAVGFSGYYSIIPGSGGAVTGFNLISGGRGFLASPSVYPDDPQCLCGTGISHVSVNDVPVASSHIDESDVSGFLALQSHSSPNAGTGFQATFQLLNGQVSRVQILHEGGGYEADENGQVELLACTVSDACCPTLFDVSDLSCCSPDSQCSSGNIKALVGFPGGSPGTSWDRCLEAVIDNASCTCGSAIEEAFVLEAGSGYVNGNLSVYEVISGECSSLAAEGEEGNGAGHNCIHSGRDFSGTFFTSPTLTCRDDSNRGMNVSECINTSVPLGSSGTIAGFDITSKGTGYNKTNVRIRLLYPHAVRCDDGVGNRSDICEQDGTITEVVVQGNSSFIVPEYYSLLTNESFCNGTCDGIPNCTGGGFSAVPIFDQVTQISSLYEPFQQIATVTRADIVNHGTGYLRSSPPKIQCFFHAVLIPPIVKPDPQCFENISGKLTRVNCTVNGSNSSITWNASLFDQKIIIEFGTLQWQDLFGTQNATSQILLPVVAGGAQVSVIVGQKSNEFGSHDACMGVDWANGAVLGAGPLIAMEERMFGFYLLANQTFVRRIVLNKQVLGNDRLFFFLKAAFGSEELTFYDCLCHLQERGHGMNQSSNGFELHRSIECLCTSYFWGLAANTSIIFVEASNRSARSNDFQPRAWVDFAIIKVAPAFPRVWTPFVEGSLPVFGGASPQSWMHSLGFGHYVNQSAVDVQIQASSATFDHSPCTICTLLPRKEQVLEGDTLRISFRQGLHLMVSKAHLIPQSDGEFRLLGLQRLFPEIKSGTQLFDVEAHLDVLDCLWSESQEIKWVLAFDGVMPFYPAGSFTVADKIVITLTGIREHEDLRLNIPLTVNLEQNHAINISSTFNFDRDDAGRDKASFSGRGDTTRWGVAFNLKWLVFHNVNFTIKANQIKGVIGVNVTHFTFSGTGMASFINDPWTLGGEQAGVAIKFLGTSGRQFPHVSAEITAHITTPDPAAVVRTLTQQALFLNYSNPTCGTTAGQDLLFNEDKVRIILSTWDSEAVGFMVPSRDARSYSCVTSNGNVPNGTPCHFPFEYNGQVFNNCTVQGWNVPWCSTGERYSGEWGECVCDKLRRGLQMQGNVVLNHEGPLLTLNERGMHDLLSPISDTHDVSGVNGTLKMYFPIFDSDASSDLEMLVTFMPQAAARCAGGRNRSRPMPTVGKAPSGECERLGYITQFLGDPGDESTVVCKSVQEVFPGGVTSGFVAAATEAMHDLRPSIQVANVAVSSPLDQTQACVDVGLVREISLCTAEKFRRIPVAAPELFGHQFCFWTDTSRNLGLDTNKFAECAVCYGPSCTSRHEPLRAWQLEDRVCFRYPCI